MNVTLEKKEDGTGIITVNIEEKDYAATVTSKLKEIGRTHTIPGFRKGHVTIDQLRRRFGRDVKSDVINHEVINAALDYIKENKINCLGEILPVEIKEINLNDADYTFQYEIGIAPNVDVVLDKNITVPFYNIDVTEEMIKQQDSDMLERFGTQAKAEVATEKALIKGIISRLNAEGAVVEGEEAIVNENGVILLSHFADKDQAALFVGAKPGDKVVFNPMNAAGNNVHEVAGMLGIAADKAEGLHDNFEFEVKEIIEVVPATHNEDYYKSVFNRNFESEEEYYAELKKFIEAQLAPNSQILFDREAEKVLVEKYGNVQLPANFLKKWLVSREEELTAENIDEQFAHMEPAIKWQIIRDTIAMNNQLAPTKEDVEAFAAMAARRQLAQYGMVDADDDMVNSFAKRMLEDERMGRQLVEQVADRKLFICIRENVNVEEKTVSLDEFKKIAQGEEL